MTLLVVLENANNGSLVTLNDKGKVGTLARAVAFANRETRMKLGQLMHAKWLANGQYRPLVDDILTCGIIPKSALPFVQGLVPSNGPVSKEALISLCNSVAYYADNVRTKDGDRKEFKGEKAFVLGLVTRIAQDNAAPETAEQ